MCSNWHTGFARISEVGTTQTIRGWVRKARGTPGRDLRDRAGEPVLRAGRPWFSIRAGDRFPHESEHAARPPILSPRIIKENAERLMNEIEETNAERKVMKGS